jgi:predicted RNA-binding protein (TIGR00451 family)
MSLFCSSLIKRYLVWDYSQVAFKTRIYNMSKSSRDALAENVSKFPGAPPVKSKDLKIAEGDDPLSEVIFDENEKIYLGFKKKKSKEEIDPQSEIFPLLRDLWLLPSRPSVIVDSGAIKFVVGGANIMRPGITKVEGEFNQGDIVVVKEEKFGKAIAVGRANASKSQLLEVKKGAVVQNLHYAGDKFWEMMKELH